MITQDGTKKYLQEVGPPIGGGTSDWRRDLQLEVPPLIRGDTSNQRWDLWLEVPPPIGGNTSNRRWDLWLEAPMLHVGISYSFEKKKRLFIVDYIKPSPVYQVKCKLVFFLIAAHNWELRRQTHGFHLWTTSR